MDCIVGDNVKRIIRNHGLTQKQMARELDICYEALNKKLNGRNEFKASEIMKMADMFNCSTDYILGRFKRG